MPTNTNYKELQSARRQMGPRRRLGGDDPLGTCDGGCKVWPAGWGHPAGVWNVNDDWYLGTLEEVCPQGCGCQHETGAKKAHCHRDKVSHWSTSASWSKISSPYGDGYCDHIPCDKGQGVTSPSPSPPPPSPSPLPPPSPIPPGSYLRPLVTFQVVLNGNLDDFNPGQTRSNLAGELGIPTESIGITGGCLPPPTQPLLMVAIGN